MYAIRSYYEISRLMQERKARAPAPAAQTAESAAAAPAAPAAPGRPLVPAGVTEVFLAARPGTGAPRYRPRLAASVRLHYVDSKSSYNFV